MSTGVPVFPTNRPECIIAGMDTPGSRKLRYEELLDHEPPCECNRIGDIDYVADCQLHDYDSAWRRALRAAEAEAGQ